MYKLAKMLRCTGWSGFFVVCVQQSQVFSMPMNDIYKSSCFQGFFFVFSGAEILPYSPWNLGDFFPNFEKQIPILEDSVNTHTHKPVLTTSTEIILGTRKCGPCQERVFIYFKLQEAIEAVKQLDQQNYH